MLSQSQINTAIHTVAQISDLTLISEKFYEKLFQQAPQTREMFGEDIQSQAKKLASVLNVAFGNLDKLGGLVPTLEEMGAKHAGYGALPEHYDLVSSTLIDTIAQDLGEKFDVSAAQSLQAVLSTVSNVMIAGAEKAK